MNSWGKLEKRDGLVIASPSKLICLRESPKLYKSRYIDKVEEKSDSMEFGTMCHMAILEPELFAEKYVTIPAHTYDPSLTELKSIAKELDLPVSGTKKELLARIRTKYEMEKTLDEVSEEIAASGKQVISPVLASKLEAIKAEVFGHEMIGSWLQVAEKERPGFYTDENGVVISFKPDAFLYLNGVGIVLDFKFTKDWDEFKFSRSNFKEGRHIQAAAYLKAISAIEGKPYEHFVFVAIEPIAPFRMRCYEADIAMIEGGNDELKKWSKEFKRRTLENDWTELKSETAIKQTSLQTWDWEKLGALDGE